MAETPDFDQIALEIRMLSHMRDKPGLTVDASIIKRLLFVWNARGAADIQALRHTEQRSDPEDSIRTLDR